MSSLIIDIGVAFLMGYYFGWPASVAAFFYGLWNFHEGMKYRRRVR